MMQLIFRNRWLTAMWAAVTLLGIGTYVSEGGGLEKINSASAEIRSQQAELQSDDGGHHFVIDPDDDGFTADSELVNEVGEEEEGATPAPSRQSTATYGRVDTATAAGPR